MPRLQGMIAVAVTRDEAMRRFVTVWAKLSNSCWLHAVHATFVQTSWLHCIKMHRPTVIIRRHRHPNILTRVLQVQHMCTTQSKHIKETSRKHARFRSFPKCTRRVVSYHRLPDNVKIRLQISFTLLCPATVEKRCRGRTVFGSVRPWVSERVREWVHASQKHYEHYISKTSEGNFTKYWSQMYMGS